MRRAPRGFSIAETLLALGLVASVLLLVVDLFPQTWWLSRMKQQRLEATRLACSLVQEAAAQPLPAQAGPPVSREVKGEGVTFTTALEARPGPPGSQRMHLRAEVNWRSLAGQPQRVVQELDVCQLEGN